MKSSVQCARLALVVAILGLLGSCRISAQSSHAVPREIDIPDGLGRDICALNDVDGDHCADFALADGTGNAWVVSGKSGKVLVHEDAAPLALAGLGGDVDGDGIWDLIAWRPVLPVGARVNSTCELGLLSGRTLREIRRCIIPFAHSLANGSACAAGDWDGDGKPDVAFGISSTPWGGVLIYSGASGELLHEIRGRDNTGLGALLACADLDHDGHPEILAGSNPGTGAERNGCMRLFWSGSSRPPQTLTTVRVKFGVALVLGPAPDVDADGWDDVLAAQLDTSGFEPPEVDAWRGTPREKKIQRTLQIRSSRTGETVRELALSEVGQCDALRTALLDDLDGDGVRELAVACDGWPESWVNVYSGKTGSLLCRHVGVRQPATAANVAQAGSFAVQLAALGDTDGDGVGDYAIGSSASNDRAGAGCVSVYSGKSGQKLCSIWKRDLFR